MTKNANPVMATFGYGAGNVIVDTLTMEWQGTPRHMLVNELAHALSLADGGPTNTAPELTLPADMTVEGNTTGGANVTFAGVFGNGRRGRRPDGCGALHADERVVVRARRTHGCQLLGDGLRW